MKKNFDKESHLENLRPAVLAQSHRARVVVLHVVYFLALGAIVVAMLAGYRSQLGRRRAELTRELQVAFDSVTSTVAATPEFFHAQVAADERVGSIMQRANDLTSGGAQVRVEDEAGAEAGPRPEEREGSEREGQLSRLRRELYEYLREDYRLLRSLDFRQLHFHLADNRSFLRFHRPQRYGDDLTSIRSTVRNTNAARRRTYGFEEGRIYNGFRYVYPLFHGGAHVGSVEISMNYRAILSRMDSSLPAVEDFLLKRDVVDSKVFSEERGNYEASCLSMRYVRESSFDTPNTAGPLSVAFSQILEQGRRSSELIRSLESEREHTVVLSVADVPVAVSLLPVRNYSGDTVAVVLRYSRMDEVKVWTSFFTGLGLALAALTSGTFLLFLRILHHRHRLLALTEDLQRTNQAKDRFFSIVSHDLRGPMGSLSALADLQREELHEINAVPPHVHETAEALADGARNSFNLLTDLLDWSRAQRGDIAFRPGRHELQGLVAEQIGVIRRTASDKGVVLENRLGELQVHADEYMLKTVIRNLLSNAVKFTPEGGRVTVTARDEAAGVTISVSDTGVGMSEEQQRKVFDPSVKTSTPGTNAEGGTGLGLTVCREFVERHGGTIRVDSELGVGSTINVYLPNPL